MIINSSFINDKLIHQKSASHSEIRKLLARQGAPWRIWTREWGWSWWILETRFTIPDSPSIWGIKVAKWTGGLAWSYHLMCTAGRYRVFIAHTINIWRARLNFRAIFLPKGLLRKKFQYIKAKMQAKIALKWPKGLVVKFLQYRIAFREDAILYWKNWHSLDSSKILTFFKNFYTSLWFWPL